MKLSEEKKEELIKAINFIHSNCPCDFEFRTNCNPEADDCIGCWCAALKIE